MFFIDKKIVNVNSDYSVREWTDLTNEFEMSIKNQLMGTRQLIIGHALTPAQSAKFTQIDKLKLLKKTFAASPALTIPEEWEDRDFMGRKFLTINRSKFDELLHLYCGGQTASSPEPDRKRTREYQHPPIESSKSAQRTRSNKPILIQ
jgi:hypothetical protein